MPRMWCNRDLKPSNMMLTDDNRVILIDFGSARMQLSESDMSRSDLCTGTPYYMCPEQIDNRDPDGRGDLYSLGIVLYEMLVGSLPYVGNTLAEIIAGHRSAPAAAACRSESCATNPSSSACSPSSPPIGIPRPRCFSTT